MPWEMQYYSETVRQDIAAWPVGIRAMYARITERVQVFGPRRAVFCTTAGQTIMILYAFIKKTQKTPQRDLELARRRLREVRRDTP